MTRTENSAKNFYTGLINQFLVLIFRFITRTILIKYLGEEYLGINGLFSNILNLLSLADLGIGTALVYSLYKPISDGDEVRQNVITKYLKKVYFTIGIIIVCAGLLLTPFLNFVVKEKVDFINLYFVYFIYIFQSASSYLFFASYYEFLGANQKKYISNNISNIIIIISNVVQILILIFLKNFYVYLLSILFFNIFQTFLIAKKTKKMFPFLNKDVNKELTKKEKSDIYKDCGSLFVYRINYVVLTATDNIIISKYIGLVMVGIYSNYVLITNSIVNILSTFFNSINASVGNLHATNDKGKDYYIFKLINFITVVCFGIFGICLYNLINEFIVLWLGKDFLLPMYLVFIIVVNLYMEGLRQLLTTYRTSYGLFRQAKFIPLFGMIVNIVVSIILVQKIGLFGVLLGTLISNLVSFLWYDPFLIYKNVFKKNPFDYYFRNLYYFIVFVLLGYICKFVCSIITINGILGFFIHGLVCVFIPLIFIMFSYYNSEYGKYIKELMKKIIRRSVSNE